MNEAFHHKGARGVSRMLSANNNYDFLLSSAHYYPRFSLFDYHQGDVKLSHGLTNILDCKSKALVSVVYWSCHLLSKLAWFLSQLILSRLYLYPRNIVINFRHDLLLQPSV